MEVRTRRTRRFSWSKVPARTLEEIVIDLGQSDDSRIGGAVRAHDRSHLEALAEQELGRPPRASRASDIAPALFRAWLDDPDVDEDAIGELYEFVRAWEPWRPRRRRVSGRRAQVAFIRSRARTTQVKRIVFDHFVRSCKEVRQVEVYPGEPVAVRGPIHLIGSGEPRAFPPYDHQVEAQKRLRRRLARSGGQLMRALIVLPTGAGKTDTVVDWTLELMAAEERPRLRVLWIAHQRELLDQAAGRYAAVAATAGYGSTFTRQLRIVHGAASPPSALGGPDVDIVVASIQSIGVRRNTAKRKLLKAFLSRPTIVVVDEAHHAGAPSYDRVLTELEKRRNLVALIGLTATPRATSPNARVKIRARFGDRPLIRVRKEELIKDQILARPRLHTVKTEQALLVTSADARRAARDDFSPEALRQLANEERDELVVSTWCRRSHDWGRTLAFATSIAHADSMAETFNAKGVAARALHSEVGEQRHAILQWFRETEDAVLVSVGMLTEGVDLPAARTAFLARPTASHVLLEQMQGRVLRGPKAGGDREAHIVYFHDLWSNFANVADPRVTPDDDEVPELRRKRSLHGAPVDVVAELERLFQQETALVDEGESTGDVQDEDADEYPYLLPDAQLVESRLVGYYDLGEEQRAVPVLAHHAEGMVRLIDAKLDPRRRRMPPLMSFFDDAHPPLPSYRSLDALVDYVEEFLERPPRESVDAVLGPTLAADEIFARGDAISEREIAEIIRRHWESLAGVAASSFAAFETSVRDELDDLRRRGGVRQRIEAPVLAPSARGVKPIPRVPSRDLTPMLRRVARKARELEILNPSQLERLGEADEDLPEIDWTNDAESTAFGWWGIELRRRHLLGQQTIKINRVLMGPPEVISDELLEFLIWHELLHHLLPGIGHRPPFREFESRWPSAQALDDELDRLHENYDLRPKRYVRGSSPA
jgi:superfamily II DNA or RNA helicase